ncbi:MAG TPA: 4-hydroxy-3-methylbut-2-enyl diphosphate reductase [Thermoanaerobaculia bacterium]|jgi:hypothetical protein
MRKTIAAVTLLLFAAVPSFAAEIRGSWNGSLRNSEPGMIHLELKHQSSHHGNSMPIGSFTGLSAAQVNAATATPATFSLRREAGTVAFDGAFKQGHGGGEFVFTPSEAYFDAVRNLGVPVGKLETRDRDRTLFSLAMIDVSTDYIRSMISSGYRVGLDDYLQMRIFDVTPQIVQEYRSIGYDKLSSDKLVELRIHKVTPAYIREMRATGWGNLGLNDLVASRIHKVTPQFAGEMKTLGYSLDFGDLTAFRIHGVTTDFVKEVRALGYAKVDADDLVAMRIHKVTPEFIREIRAAGYENVPIDKLVSMRIHGVDATYLKKMKR